MVSSVSSSASSHFNSDVDMLDNFTYMDIRDSELPIKEQNENKS